MKVSLVVLAAFVLTALLRRHSAALRHWILAMAIVCAMAVPALESIVPPWHVPISPDAVIIPPGSITLSSLSYGGTAPAPAAPAAETPTSRSSWWSDGITGISQWLVRGWAIGIALSALVLIIGLGKLARLGRRARPVTDARWTALLEGIRVQCGLRRSVMLLRTDHPSFLGTWGFWRPRIVVPAGAASWPDDLVRAVLYHEVAHIVRRDWLVQIAGELLRCIYWFNPLVWLACRRLRLESEHACDDEVLRRGVAAPEYASHLLTLARTLQRPRAAWLPATAMARPSSLQQRVKAMLNEHLDRSSASVRSRIVTVSTFVVLGIAIAAAQTLVTFSGSVLDPQGAALPDAKLTLSNAARQAKYEIRTDRSGQFEFPGLPAGDYIFEAVVPGFTTFRQPLTIGGDNIEKNGIKLDIGTLQETVTVVDGPDEGPRPNRPMSANARPKPACPAGPTDGSVPVGGNIRPPAKILHVAPVFPPHLRGTDVQGTVLMEGRIGLDGFIKDIQVRQDPHPDFTDAAIKAVSQWQFDQTLLNCVPVEVLMKMTVNFIHRP